VSAPPSIVLGTAQWGMDYGVANRHGPPDDHELARVLGAARRAGVTKLDTAAAYGNSELRIGEAVGADPGWHVTTKLDPRLAATTTPSDARRLVASELAAARRRLRRPRLDAVLLHGMEQLDAHDGAIWAALRESRETGIVRTIGVSVADVRDAAVCMDHDGVEVVQLAVSLLDRRAIDRGLLAHARERDVAVMGRSPFLQGAALLEPGSLPAHLGQLAGPLSRLRAWCAGRERELPATLLAWVLALPLAGVVAGVERAEQLEQQVRALAAPLTAAERDELETLVGELPDALLDPWCWP
jgi:aryl-alcohol dehydrogenase-like predicted oxidoreductase